MAARKTPAKKTPAKKAPAKKAAAKKAPVAPAKKIPAVKERYSKTQILNQIAENTELSRKDVAAVLDELTDMIEGHIKKRACGEFVMPGLLKIVTIKKPAKKARKNVPNPFRPGELMDVAAKPASIQVKIRPLKKLKEMAE
ncbi:DNA-binding protein [Alteromonadaceae bacterium Bs31]|nr:DNA-binding protein [Alteromonadaceae bacterium Bs31]